MIINQASLKGLNISFSTAFQKAFDSVPTDWKDIAMEVPSSTTSQNYGWIGQMPEMREWIGDREVQNLSAYSYVITNKEFEMTIGVSRSEIEDDQYGVYTPLFANMGDAAAHHPSRLLYDLLMSGFDAKRPCYDGKAFFAEDHELGENTYSNAGKEELSAESFKKARAAIMSICGDKGKSLRLVPDTLVVSPANEMTARLILEADQIDGTTNVLKGLAKVKVVPELAEHPDYWFLLCTSRPVKPLIYQQRKPIKFVSKTADTDDNVFMQGKYLYGADGRSNAGFGLWQMAYGSTGETKAQG